MKEEKVLVIPMPEPVGILVSRKRVPRARPASRRLRTVRWTW
jgi:hypothetical protein